MNPRQRKSILIFSLAGSLILSLVAIISQEILFKEFSSAYYVLTLAIIGCVLLLLSGFAWDRETETQIEKLGETVKREIPFASSFSNDEEGGIMGMAQQIERMARSLQHVEASYRAIVEDQTELICRFRRGGQLTFVNGAYCRMCETKRQNLIGDFFLPLSAGIAKQQNVKLIHNLSPKQSIVTIDHEFSAPDRKTVWLQWTCRAFFDAEGNPFEYQAIGRDVTDRKAAEEEIRRLAAFPESNPNPVLEFCPKGTITYMNEAAREKVLASDKESVWEILPENAGVLVQECLNKKTLSDSIEVQSGGRTFAWSFYPQLSGKVVHAYGQEITKQRQLEKELYQAQKLEDLGTLSGGIAHEFNNLLAVICGYSEVTLQNLKEDDPHHTNLKNVLRAGERGAMLVKQILTFARQTDVIFSSVDINKALKEHQSLLAGTFSKMISLELDLTDNLPEIRAEPHQLEQILMNLSINARDSMPEGGTLTFRTKRIPPGHLPTKETPGLADEYLCVCVSDTGHGIDKDICERIFDPFFTTKENSKGTGLGLSVVYGIVQNHGGQIDVKSKPGEGTDFCLYFPVASGAKPALPYPMNTEEALGGEETLLIVDDEPQILNWMRELLAMKGYRTLGAHSGKEALEIFRDQSEEIAVIISDLDMPRMNGLQLLKEVRTINPDVPFIASTGYLEPVVKSRLFVEGMFDFLNKPFRGEELLAKVRKALDHDENELPPENLPARNSTRS
ncbi:MAG: response regulator [Opitutales bacterium]